MGKGNAARKFEALKTTEELLGKMLSALAWQVNQPQWTRDGGKFIPHPATWLHQHRWEDEPFETTAESANDAAWAEIEAKIASRS